jgi:hypothetical protein
MSARRAAAPGHVGVGRLRRLAGEVRATESHDASRCRSTARAIFALMCWMSIDLRMLASQSGSSAARSSPRIACAVSATIARSPIASRVVSVAFS